MEDARPETVLFCSTFDGESSHALLARSAALLTGLPAQEFLSLHCGPCGKPAFAQHPALHFSLSHSGAWWVCAFADRPLGADVQQHASHMPPATLSRRFFHPLEDRYLARGGYREFYDLWSAKESWVKYTGTGFYREPESFSVVSEAGVFPCAADGARLQLLPFREGYSLCLCTEAETRVRFVTL